MTIIDTAEGDLANDRDRFTAQIADETFAFRDFHFNDRRVTGSQIAEAFGAYPLTDYVVLHHLPNHQLETLRPNETADLKDGAHLFVIRGDGTDRFFVDGIPLEWPRKALTGANIKWLAGKDEDLELVLERQDQPDKVIGDDEEVRIGNPGVEKLYTRPAQVSITIVVNTRPKVWNKKRISFEELVAIAFPTPPPGQNIVYTIGYFDGPPNRPEGSLTEGESVRVRDQMVFDVKFTDKS
ncbi:multiubiquitin domain-containing protein [Pleomorphomonas oryzae]|uniref:multiubiquitin domain-containing protein n=1 Tax=Pleomorphomonas oryzae TaxID=261934 RepID=UPI00041193C8|nr:multiubiquitin domain-containing protein [Pleomorphomonas oryzae]